MDTRKKLNTTMADISDEQISDEKHNKKPSPILAPLSQDITDNKIYPNMTLAVLGVFAQASHQAEAETAFLRLLQSAVDAEPESYRWYDIGLLSSLRENKRENAETNKFYFSDDGSYFVRDQEGIVREGKIDNKTMDLSDIKKKIHDTALKNKIFELISTAGRAPAYRETTQLAAIAILKRHPDLLFREGVVTDHFGRKIKGSPYRLLLGAGDVWALKQVHEQIIATIADPEARAKAEEKAKAEFQAQFPGRYDLCLLSENVTLEKNKVYLAKTPKGFISYTVITPKGDTVCNIATNIPAPQAFSLDELNKLKSQILEVTSNAGHTDPDYKGSWPITPDMPEEALYDDRNRAQITDVQTQLNIIVAAITADPCTNGQATLDATRKAVEDLCQLFAPKEGEIIKTGLHFPLGIMREIYNVYGANFNPWSYAKLAFFSRAVIGSAEAALTAVDGQSVKNGLANLKMEKGPDRRDGLFCRHPRGIPSTLAPLPGKLGNTMFVDPYDGESCFMSSSPGFFDWYDKKGWAPADGRPRVLPCAALENLWRTKAESIGNYYAATRREVNTPTRSP